MKLSTKIILLVVTALLLNMISFCFTCLFNKTTNQYNEFHSEMIKFENILLTTIVKEKDYMKTLDEKTAKSVLKNNIYNIKFLKNSIIHAYQYSNNLKFLSGQIQNYNNAFSRLTKNNHEILSSKKESDELIKGIYDQSDKIINVINEAIGTAYIEIEEPDPALNYLLTSITNLSAWLSKIILVVNRDLLLEGKEDIFLKQFKDTSNGLTKEIKKIIKFSSNLTNKFQEPAYINFAKYIEKNIGRLNELIALIHKFWQENKKLNQQLNNVRQIAIKQNSILTKSIEKSLVETKQRNLFYNLITMGIGLFILIIGGLFIGRSITKPIQKIASFAKKVSKGDLSELLSINNKNKKTSKKNSVLRPEQCNPNRSESSDKNQAESGKFKSQDEISILVESFNTMTINLRTLIKKIQDVAHETKNTVKNLVEASDEINNASKIQSDKITSTSAAITQMSASIQHISQSSKTADEMASSTENSASEGAVIVNNTVEGLNEITINIRKAEVMTKQLGEKSNEINKIINAITGISRQTNLLALNAAVEAARAGHHGKGFAVVADEVRNLAERSSSNANEISGIIEMIRNEIDATIEIINQSIKSSTAGMELTKELKNSFKNIHKNVNNTHSNVADITSAITQQATVCDEVAMTTEQITASTKQTENKITHLLKQIEYLQQITEIMEADITKFII
ncbi:methyl-accepting chemotaxis protein [Candidatus Magnetomoraceae bacterium gMMP-13]